MRKVLCVLCVFVVSSLAFATQKPEIKPDSPEEKALHTARLEADPAKRAALLDDFVQKFPQLAPVAYPIYLTTYVEAKDWDKALEFGRKAAEADPNDHQVPLNMMKAAAGKGDFAAAAEWGSTAGAMINKALAAKPADIDEDDWNRKAIPLRNDLNQVEYGAFDAALKIQDGPKQAAALEKFVATFPSGAYAKLAPPSLAMAYQRAGDVAKMSAAAEKAVEADPNNERMHLLLGDVYLSQKRLDLSLQHARDALKILETKTRPENISEADWAASVKSFRGAAHSIAGRTFIMQEKDEQAIPELKSAADMLADNPQVLAPVLFNLAWGYAKLKRMADARVAIKKAAAIPGPYQKPSRDLAAKLAPK